MSVVTVAAPASVDIVATPAATSAAVASNEPSMAEYAARREAESRGEQYEVKPAAVAPESTSTPESTSAAATGDPAAATSTSAAVEAELEESHPAKKGISKRFGELTQARDKAAAEAATARAEAATAKAESERVAAEAAEAKAELERMRAAIPVVPTVEEDPTPTRDTFDDPDSYAAAVAAHAARSEIRKANASAEAARVAAETAARAATEAERTKEVQAQITELHKNFNERMTTVAASTDYPDFSEKVTNNADLVLKNDTFFLIEQSEMAPHILYHLASNPAEVASLEKLSPYQAAMRLGEIQVAIREARKPVVSKAAEPVKPVGSRQSPERKTPHEETMEEYAARREQEETAARKKKVRTH